MKLQLVSVALCPYVHRAAIMLHEKGVTFERTTIDLKNKPDWFLKISPRGKVPVLIADGRVLFESTAINEFLDETHAPRILPEDPFERAVQRAWVEIANDISQTQWDFLAASSPEEREERDQQRAPFLQRLQDALENNVIAEFDWASIALAPSMLRYVLVENKTRRPLLDDFPVVSAYAKRIASRRSVVESVPPNYGDLIEASMRRRGSNLF